MYAIMLKNAQNEDERITLGTANTKEGAEEMRKTWRRLLGRNWHVGRRPGLDSLEHVVLVIERRN